VHNDFPENRSRGKVKIKKFEEIKEVSELG
jgi:hypothetical protein